MTPPPGAGADLSSIQWRGPGQHARAAWPECGDFSWSLLAVYPAWVLMPGGCLSIRSGKGTGCPGWCEHPQCCDGEGERETGQRKLLMLDFHIHLTLGPRPVWSRVGPQDLWSNNPDPDLACPLCDLGQVTQPSQISFSLSGMWE